VRKVKDRVVGFVVGVTLVLGLAGARAAFVNNALTSPAALQIGVKDCCIDFASADTVCTGVYSVIATGNGLGNGDRIVIPGNNGAIIDTTSGVQIAASTPAAISTARDSLMSNFNTSAGNAAAAGKFNK